MIDIMLKKEIRFHLSSGIFARVLPVVQNDTLREQDTQLSPLNFFNVRLKNECFKEGKKAAKLRSSITVNDIKHNNE